MLLIVVTIFVFSTYFTENPEELDLENIGDMVKPKIEDLKQFMGALKGKISGAAENAQDNAIDSPDVNNDSEAQYPIPKGPDITIFDNQLPVDNFSEPLPSLNDSDQSIINLVGRVLSKDYFSSQLRMEAVILRFVVTVDNLTKKKLAKKYRLVKESKGKFLTSIDLATKDSIDEQYYIDENNYQRYAGFMKLISGIEADKLIAVYIYYYPLIQEAYDSLGYSGRYFNDRFVDVIDHLLETPRTRRRHALERSTVTYKYINAKLEARSAGQKIIMRIGPENERVLRRKLQQLRAALTKFEPDAK